jgi:diguanylate cyclase (GGDEF)-like protein
VISPSGVTGQIGLMIENARLYGQALSLALTDGLTGLFNHRHFHQALDQEIARAFRDGRTFSLLMLDIDRFKAYNDTFGHLAGDKLIKGISDCLAATIRGGDTAFRYGGEEFTVILPGTEIESAYQAAERIREAVTKQLSSDEISSDRYFR